MTKLKLTFYECEHHGDLDKYKEDVIKCGATIIGEEIDTEEEEGFLIVETENSSEFKKKIRLSDSYDFLLQIETIKE